MKSSSFFFVMLAHIWPVAHTATPISSSAQQVCDEIHSTTPSRLAYAPSSSKASSNSPELTALYANTTSTYWDEANDADVPACVFFPASAEEVSAAIVALRNQSDVPFALKSGGHNWNRGFSSTDGGVLISFRPNLQDTALAADGKTAKVGPGARWLEVMEVLDPSNKCVVGGRVGDVGVGGYLVQGGISYLSAQHGFACDNVVEFELVTANGTILTASQGTNPDIFWALRGGGNAFGIVTTYTLQTYDIGDVWGGEMVYDSSQISKINEALWDFTANNQDARAAIILGYDFIAGNRSEVVTVTYFYDGPTPPSDVFAAFTSIPHQTDTTETQRYPELLDSPATSAVGLRTTNAVNSFPNMPSTNMTSFLDWHWNRSSDAWLMHSLQAFNIELFSMALQPISIGLQQASALQGPAALSLDPANGDKLWIEYDAGWKNSTCDDQCPEQLKQLVDQALDYQKQTYAGVQPTHYVSGDLSFVPYNPLFMNDAQYTQDVLGSYGAATFATLKSLNQELDPTGFLTSRQNGFFFDSNA